MAANQLFAVTDDGLLELAIPERARNLTDLYDGLSLGVYSALRTFDHNKFLALEAHLDRTERSMAILGWQYRFDRARFRRALDTAVSHFPSADARVRFDILAEPARAFGTDSRELIALTPFSEEPAEYYTQGVGIDLVPSLSRFEPQAKTAEFAERRSRMLPARSQAHYEYLMLDDEDNILEGTLTNFWAVRDGCVWTAGEGVLEGITRHILIDLIPTLGIPVKLQAVNRSEIPTFEEAFLSGSSRAVLPVVRIASHEIGNGRPGIATRQILRAYQSYVRDHVQRAV
ncbi:MAG: aminotransferase class IV [Candidatus Promineifilaceae bacterium]